MTDGFGEPLPEPDDPRELPAAPTPVDPPTTRRTVATAGLVADAAAARFADVLSRPPFWVALVLVAVVTTGWRLSADGSVVVALVWGLAAAAVYALLTYTLGARVFRKIYPRGKEVAVDIAPSGLTMRVEKGSFHTDWSAFRDVREVREHLVLRMRRSAASIVVPPELLGADAEEVARAGIRGAGRQS